MDVAANGQRLFLCYIIRDVDPQDGAGRCREKIGEPFYSPGLADSNLDNDVIGHIRRRHEQLPENGRELTIAEPRPFTTLNVTYQVRTMKRLVGSRRNCDKRGCLEVRQLLTSYLETLGKIESSFESGAGFCDESLHESLVSFDQSFAESSRLTSMTPVLLGILTGH